MQVLVLDPDHGCVIFPASSVHNRLGREPRAVGPIVVEVRYGHVLGRLCKNASPVNLILDLFLYLVGVF